MTVRSDKDLRLHRLFLRALSNETRLRILDLLRTGTRNVSQISEDLGYEQSRVSHNLRCLLTCGFVEMKQVGRARVYALTPTTTLPLLDLIARHVVEYGGRLRGCETLTQARKIHA
ncbi:MAG: ArsR/SmtB family transcription factor [Candidatus Geothermarchaeales archaeon]